MAVSAYGVYVLVGAVAAFVLSGVVYFTAPNRRANRLLALLLFFEATAQGSVAALNLGGFAQANPSPTAHGIRAVFASAVLLLPVLYLLFLATLDSPLVRPLRSRTVQVALVAFGVAALVLRTVRPDLFRDDAVATGVYLAFALFGLVALFGLAVAASAYRRAAAGTLEHRQAGAYLAAFGSRDVLFVAFFTVFALGRLGVDLGGSWPGVLPPLATLLFALFMAYGILRTQLFDIDLKVRWTVKQSTVAAIFLAVFFAVSEAAAAFFEGQVGTYLGIAAAALLVFGLAPLQRVAENVAERAVPRARTVTDMDAGERARVYRGMVRAAFRDGTLDAHERVMLADLRAELGLSSDETERLELQAAHELATGPRRREP